MIFIPNVKGYDKFSFWMTHDVTYFRSDYVYPHVKKNLLRNPIQHQSKPIPSYSDIIITFHFGTVKFVAQ